MTIDAIALDLTDRCTLVSSLPHGGTVAEIGVQGGVFSRSILDFNRPEKLYLIDCWEHQADDVYGADPSNYPDEAHEILRALVQRTFCTDPRVHIVKAYSQQATAWFPSAFFDWIYIDANHLQVCQDIETWWRTVKPGGWFVGHDYCMLGDFITVKDDLDKYIAEKGFELHVTRERSNSPSITATPSWAFQKPLVEEPCQHDYWLRCSAFRTLFTVTCSKCGKSPECSDDLVDSAGIRLALQWGSESSVIG